MLTSIALIFLLGLLLSAGFQKLKLPGLLGMIIAGMILSPHALNLLDPSILAVAEDGSMTGIAGDLRQLALVVILSRAGLALDLTDLKKVGRPAVMMCFVPACFEMVGVVLLAPALLHVTVLEAAVMGSVLAAVSPAVVVPRMLKLMEEGYGKEHSIPQLILAGASVDDVFVIVMFTAFTALAGGGKVSALSFLQIPVSVVLGILLGAVAGMALVWLFDTFTSRDTVKLLITLSASFLMLALQNVLEGMVPVSGLLGIMSMGIWIRRSRPGLANLLSGGYNQLWVAAEVLLFVLVGATVDLAYVRTAGVMAVLIVCGALFFRMAGVFACVFGTPLTGKERLFCMVAYTPKATVQAAIGAIPLTMGLACGHQVLTVAVLAILITAPFGAICMDRLYKRLLSQ